MGITKRLQMEQAEREHCKVHEEALEGRITDDTTSYEHEFVNEDGNPGDTCCYCGVTKSQVWLDGHPAAVPLS